MHIRGGKDLTKSGAQIEKEWDEAQKKKSVGEEGEEEQVIGNAWDVRNLRGGTDAKKKRSSNEEFPHACFICRNGFRDPVVTRCGHFFCLRCAMAHNLKGPQCAACGGNTRGIFNEAKGLKRHLALQKMKEREKALGLKEKAEAAAQALTEGVGGEGSGEGGWDEVDVSKEQAEADAAEEGDGWGSVDVKREQEEADAAEAGNS